MTASPEGSVVLVAEDETLIGMFANDILTDAGYCVLEAYDGHKALTILEVRKDVRALFTDINMPNLDGLSLVKIVRERWPHIACVTTSGIVAPECDGFFVPKPYTSETVLPVLHAALADKQNKLITRERETPAEPALKMIEISS